MKLSIKEKVAYGLGDAASNFVWALMMNWIMFFYTDIFGITAAAAGTMLLFARASDGGVDFLMGAIADRTKSRWGRFRPYLLWMCLPLALVFVLTFTTPNFSVPNRIIYAWISYNLLMFLYTAINIPYSALSGVMTDDPVDRTSLNSYRMALAQIGGIIANSSFLVLIKYFGQDTPLGPVNQQKGAQMTVLLFSGLSIALFLIAFAFTRERIQPPAAQKTLLREDLKTLFSNRHWLVMFVGGITNITFVIARSSAGIYYLKNYLHWEEAQISAYFLTGGIFFILGATLTQMVVKAMGRKAAFMLTMALCGITAIPYYWMAPDQTSLIYTCQILGSLVAGVNATLFWAMIADTADFSEWKFKVRTTGIIFSATTCSQKVGMGIGAAFAGGVLSHYGYVANATQSADSIHGILLLSSLIPAAGQIFLAAIFKFYGLTEKVCESMRQDLVARRLSAAEPALVSR